MHRYSVCALWMAVIEDDGRHNDCAGIGRQNRLAEMNPIEWGFARDEHQGPAPLQSHIRRAQKRIL